MRNDVNDSNDRSKVIQKIRNRSLKLYVSKTCPHCKTQLDNLGLNFDNIGSYKGIIVCSGDEDNCKDVTNEGVPVWVKGNKKFLGVHTAGEILSKLNGNSFGKNSAYNASKLPKTNNVPNANLSDQPQPMGYTEYGTKRGGSLGCYEENLNVMKKGYKTLNQSKYLYGKKRKKSKKRKKRFGKNLLNWSKPKNAGQAPLQRPYGPRSQWEMRGVHGAGSKLPPLPVGWEYTYGQSYGKRKSKKKKKTKKRRRSKRKFGVTPGTKAFSVSPTPTDTGVILYLPLAKGSAIQSSEIPFINVPLQFSNNDLNTPLVLGFGKIKKRSNKKKGRRRYGNWPTTNQMKGPNKVAHEVPMNMYTGAGGNTVDWSTDTHYLPNGPKLETVAKTTSNPRGWLSNAKTINENNSYRYSKLGYDNGKRGNMFGQGIYSSSQNVLDSPAFVRDKVSGTGAKNIFQPFPPTMHLRESISGKNTKNPLSKLRTRFGGSVITLTKKGEVKITNE